MLTRNKKVTYRKELRDLLMNIALEIEDKTSDEYLIAKKLLFSVIPKNTSGYIDYIGFSKKVIGEATYLDERKLEGLPRTKVWNRSTTRVRSSFNKVFGRILGLDPDWYTNPVALNNLVTKLIHALTKDYQPETLYKDRLLIVKGEDIRKYYHADNYSRNSGTLGDSCMRYVDAQKYLDIYVHNPESVSLGVFLEENGKVSARALIWNNEVFDRIYFTNDDVARILGDFLSKKFPKGTVCGRDRNSAYKQVNEFYKTTLKVNPSGRFPYMDSLYYYYGDGVFGTHEKCEEAFYQMRETNGSYQILKFSLKSDDIIHSMIQHEDDDEHECPHCGTEIDHDDIVTYRGDTYCIHCTTYSDYLDEHIPEDDAIRVLNEARTIIVVDEHYYTEPFIDSDDVNTSYYSLPFGNYEYVHKALTDEHDGILYYNGGTPGSVLEKIKEAEEAEEELKLQETN